MSPYNQAVTQATMNNLVQQQQQALAQKSEADLTALKGEWGQAWDENINLGKRAAQTFGLDQAKLEKALGAYLDSGQIRALVARRDALLKTL